MMKTYPPEVKLFIQENYVGIGPKQMVELLNTNFGTNYTRVNIKTYYQNHKISSGLTGHFEKDHLPHNKGRRGYLVSGTEKGWFCKGIMPHNTLPVGAEIIRDDGYVWVKVEDPKKWRQKHIIEWENVNGPVPKRHVVTFLDGNKSNITLENLMLITKAESLELSRSKLRSSNAEFTKTGVLIVKVKKAGANYKKRG